MKRIWIVAVLLSTLFTLSAAAQQTPAGRGNAPAQPSTPPAAPRQGGAQQPPATPPATPAAARPATPPPAPTPFPAGGKMGFVNMQLLVQESKLGKAGLDRLKKLQTDNQTKLTALQKGLQDQQAKIQAQAGVASDAALTALRRDGERMQLELQTEQTKAQAAEQNLNSDLLEDFSEKVMPIIDELIKEKDLWVIWGVQDAAQGSSIVVVAVNPGLDLSAEIVKRLDVKYPG
jgi:Skp family chaperone for outer membrane proteins